MIALTDSQLATARLLAAMPVVSLQPRICSGIYRDTLTAGDTRIVRIRLDWGQRFTYLVTTAAQAAIQLFG